MDMTKEDLKAIIKESIIEAKPKATMTVDECAAYSGIGSQKIRQLAAKRNSDFPHFKVGVKTLIPKEAFDIWLAEIAEIRANL